MFPWTRSTTTATRALITESNKALGAHVRNRYARTTVKLSLAVIDFLQRLGDAVCMLAGALCGNPCSTRPYTRRIQRHYRAFKASNPDKPESFIIQLVAAWLMSEWAKPETRSRWSALLRELRDRPTDDLKRAAVSIICIQNGVDERYWTDASNTSPEASTANSGRRKNLNPA